MYNRIGQLSAEYQITRYDPNCKGPAGCPDDWDREGPQFFFSSGPGPVYRLTLRGDLNGPVDGKYNFFYKKILT